jgi:hypothetical protein
LQQKYNASRFALLSCSQARAWRVFRWLKGAVMFLILAIVLLLLWGGGFFVFHAAGFLIHILIILAVISLIFHFLRGGRAV